jgi:hypothetical protein
MSSARRHENVVFCILPLAIDVGQTGPAAFPDLTPRVAGHSRLNQRPVSGSRIGRSNGRHLAQSDRSSALKIRLQNLAARLQAIKIIRPVLHHFDPFVPMGATGIGAADIVGFDMGQLPFDGVWVPIAHLVQQGACGRTEPMGRNLLLPKAQAT